MARATKTVTRGRNVQGNNNTVASGGAIAAQSSTNFGAAPLGNSTLNIGNGSTVSLDLSGGGLGGLTGASQPIASPTSAVAAPVDSATYDASVPIASGTDASAVTDTPTPSGFPLWQQIAVALIAGAILWFLFHRQSA